MSKKRKAIKELKSLTPQEIWEEIEKNPDSKEKLTEYLEQTQEYKKQYAEQYAAPATQAANTYITFKHKEEPLDYGEISRELEAQNKALRNNNLSRVEDILMAQAQTLDFLFHREARKAAGQEYMLQFKTHMDMAFKAQRQCRATLETLAEIKNPKPYIQNNRAQYQQVNNGMPEPHAHGENLKSSNGLLKDKRHETEWLDTGAPQTAGGNDKELEAVGAQHRAED